MHPSGALGLAPSTRHVHPPLVSGYVRTELSARAQREVERARRECPHSLGRRFEDTPGIVQRDSDDVGLVETLEEHENRYWWPAQERRHGMKP